MAASWRNFPHARGMWGRFRRRCEHHAASAHADTHTYAYSDTNTDPNSGA